MARELLESRAMTTRRLRAASTAILAAEAAFVALLVPAIRAYPGGSDWHPAISGHDFWLNYLCDLTRRVALNGEPNQTGAVWAQAAMTALALGLVPVWWLVPRLFPSRALLGGTVRVLGSVAAAGTLAVILMPSDRFGPLHGISIILAGVPGLTAVLLAVYGLLREEPGPRVAAILGGAMLLVATVDFVLYVRQFGSGDPGPAAIAILERISTIFLLAWMAAVAWRVRALSPDSARRASNTESAG
jgi:hypothetical protein